MNYQINEEKLQTETMNNISTMGIWKRLLGMISKPSETFADIARQPKIGKALVVILILNAIFTLVSLPYIMEFAKKTMPSNLPQGAGAVAIGAVIGGSIFGVLIGIPLALVIISAVYKIIFMMTGEDGDFSKIFTVNLYAQVPVVLGTLVKSIILIMKPAAGLTAVQTSLALVLPKSQIGTPLYTFLSTFDLFSIWTYILVAIGFVTVFGLSRKKSYSIVGSLFIIKILFTVVPAIFLKGLIPGGANINVK